jgi:hypothetical protein
MSPFFAVLQHQMKTRDGGWEHKQGLHFKALQWVETQFCSSCMNPLCNLLQVLSATGWAAVAGPGSSRPVLPSYFLVRNNICTEVVYLFRLDLL